MQRLCLVAFLNLAILAPAIAQTASPVPQGSAAPSAGTGQPPGAPGASPSSPLTTGALNPSTVAVSRVNVMTVYNGRNEKLGEVDRVVQGPNGQQWVVIGWGGVLGLGEIHIAIPAERLALGGDRLIAQGMTTEQLKTLPSFDRNDRGYRELEGTAQIRIAPGA